MHKQKSIKHMHSHIYTTHCKHTRMRARTHTHTHTPIHTRTQSARGRDRQGECAGSAVSAFSGTCKYPCLDKASHMLRKASRITTVSISPHPSSECHASHRASLTFTSFLSCAPAHAKSRSEICWEPLSYKLAYCTKPRPGEQKKKKKRKTDITCGLASWQCGVVYMTPRYIYTFNCAGRMTLRFPFMLRFDMAQDLL